MSDLPVKSIIPHLCEALSARGNAVLVSPPGSGKSTYLPLQLLNESWLAGKRIIMLEPRRLAARNVAFWMAHQLGEVAGKTVGYRMRGDSAVGKHTRIEVVTEGILTRMLQGNPELEEYGLVIFDEFHERNLNSDLALSLCLDLQQNLRDDLRLLVMSATLEAEPVARLMNDAPVITSEGRTHPITMHYWQTNVELRNASTITNAIQNILGKEQGDVLVFLPGAGEIQRVYADLNKTLADTSITVYPIYGSLSQAEQELAISPSVDGKRKVVLATNIAETSLTIEGIKVVIDSGFQRQARYHASSGMTRLDTTRVARANADQRAGRAGRMGPGVCYRLWTEDTQRSLLPANDPEIMNADLTSLVLELAQWGVRDVMQLNWLTPPPQASVEQARSLLIQLGALTTDGVITEHGKKVLELGTHPRLAHMILLAEQRGMGTLACDIAALLNDRDILVNESSTDLQLRLEVLRQLPHTKGMPLHHATLQRVRKESQSFQKQLQGTKNSDDTDCTGILLAMAYPDRIAKKRNDTGTQYVLSNGKGAMLSDDDALRKHEFLVISNLDGRKQNARIFSAASISEQQLVDLYSSQIVKAQSVFWDKKDKAVKATEQTRLFELVLQEKRSEAVDPQQILSALLQGIREEGIDVLPWGEEARNWQSRVMLLHKFDNTQWPDVSDSVLLETLALWLGPYLNKIARLSQITEATLKNALENLLDWNAQQQLEKLAPTHFQVPSGSRVRIDYCEGEVPVLKVRLQEMFGLQTTPSISNGKQPLLLHLLSPARRPIQVTQDLTSFWKNTYLEVKKDLKGRYPKHYWPDDPLVAEPTSRAKPRK